MDDRFPKEIEQNYPPHSNKVPEPADQPFEISLDDSYCVPAAPPLLIVTARVILRCPNNSHFNYRASHVNIPPIN